MTALRTVQISPKSEWALARFFHALRDKDISEKFQLTAMCAREKTRDDLFGAFLKSVNGRVDLLCNPKFRAGNRKQEIESLLWLLDLLVKNKADYCPVNGNQTLPEDAYDKCDVIAIHSKNTCHLGYLQDAVAHSKNLRGIICEKPLVTIMDTRGEASRDNLEKLLDLTGVSDGLVLMDAEHYSYKQAALIFYQNLPKILGGARIKRVEGCIKEKDDPEFGRTRDILNLQNETGILTDTGVHLLAFISNLGGKAIPKYARYGIYPTYDVETFAEAEYEIQGDSRYFSRDATARFTVAKFIDKFKTPEHEESKLIKFVLDDNSEVIVDFKKGSVRKKQRGIEQEYTSSQALSSNEYVNVLNHLHNAIETSREPMTCFRNSITSLESAYLTYKDFPIAQHAGGVYESN